MFPCCISFLQNEHLAIADTSILVALPLTDPGLSNLLFPTLPTQPIHKIISRVSPIYRRSDPKVPTRKIRKDSVRLTSEEIALILILMLFLLLLLILYQLRGSV